MRNDWSGERTSFRLLAILFGVALTVALATAVALSATSRALNPPPQLPAGSPAGRVLVVGDSVAYLTGEALAVVAADQRFEITNGGTPGCGFVRGGEVLTKGEWVAVDPACHDSAGRWQALVDQSEPEVVVLLVGFWDAFDRRTDGRVLEFGSPEADEYLRSELHAALDVLTSDGATVMLLTTPYFVPAPDGQSLSARDEQRVAHINDLFREVTAERAGQVEVHDLNRRLTPGGYRQSISGVDMRGDGIHLTPAGKQYVADWLAPEITELIISRRSP